MLPWTIRAATEQDIPHITAMYRFDGFSHLWGDPARASWLYASIQASGGAALIAVEHGAVTGHLDYGLSEEPLPAGRYGSVTSLEVRTDYRRQGVATALLHESFARMREARASRVEVVAEHQGARALYHTAGFTPYKLLDDLDLLIPPDDLRDAAPTGQPLTSSDQPWRSLQHVAGHLFPAAYSWQRAFLAAQWHLPEAEGCGAWRLAGGAVIFADPWLVHLFMPSTRAAIRPEVWPLWLSTFALRASNHDGWVRTVLPHTTARALHLPERYPGSSASPVQVLAQRL